MRHNAVVRRLLVAVLLAVVLFPVPAAHADRWRQATVIDGDSIRLGNGREVRLLGFDAPEWGTCGFWPARSKMGRLISDGVRLRHRSGHDRYGRILAYVRTRDGRDAGTVMLRKGLAVARYDSRDGYPWHPLEDRYRRLDARNGQIRC